MKRKKKATSPWAMKGGRVSTKEEQGSLVPAEWVTLGVTQRERKWGCLLRFVLSLISESFRIPKKPVLILKIFPEAAYSTKRIFN